MRDKHVFQFSAKDIAEAAKLEAEYHRERVDYWKVQQDFAMNRVRAVAKVEVKEFPVTGGKRVDLAINYGDGADYRRMIEAYDKIILHSEAAERFDTDVRVYGTQGDRMYELETGDVHYYRLGGGPRQE